eukprot:TRINITY_DN904_c0_g1_i1.p1 TRINITY_DN904_c0_g1~~TRINITY_DN904_c0_g1_i1.p1  ORF type:complete len:260 (+),score=84.94 TRINITY_DN904_c0_g1_i1:70-849(+)
MPQKKRKAAPSKAPAKVEQKEEAESDSDFSDIEDELEDLGISAPATDEKEEVDETPLPIDVLKKELAKISQSATQLLEQSNLDEKKSEAKPAKKTGVVYIGHLPHGFYENQLRQFFTQFGQVLRVRVSRNPKTNKSRHYAFVEFRLSEVAKIAAQAMNNYMMFGKTLSCEVIPEEKVHPKLFVTKVITNRMKQGREKKRQRIRQLQNHPTPEQVEQRRQNAIKKQNSKKKKLAELGIDYKFPEISLRPLTRSVANKQSS